MRAAADVGAVLIWGWRARVYCGDGAIMLSLIESEILSAFSIEFYSIKSKVKTCPSAPGPRSPAADPSPLHSLRPLRLCSVFGVRRT